ncbi:hypothetical protein [Anaerotignum propionicum]|uniref:hypothetical protein n=1 Tax=Anaerotignum propionicum TaxID=28446 RepID=UPI00289F3BEC|nr:hypothetical protein [Anaerotignum propionicum]
MYKRDKNASDLIVFKGKDFLGDVIKSGYLSNGHEIGVTNYIYNYLWHMVKLIGNISAADAAGSAAGGGLKADLGKKLEYVFGNATGTKHNIDRSIAMEKQLNSNGIFDNKVGREIVQNNLTKVFNDSFSIVKVQDNGRIVRESLLSGPNGLVKVESIWEVAN